MAEFSSIATQTVDIDIETEEIIADFMSLYGRNIVYTADKIFNLLEQKYG